MRYPRPAYEVTALGGGPRFRGMDVLDIGTGDGRLAVAVARHARSVLGIDTSEESIGVARASATRLGVANVRFLVGDAADTDLGRRRFDVAIFSWSL